MKPQRDLIMFMTVKSLAHPKERAAFGGLPPQDCLQRGIYLFRARATLTAQATVQPTIGLLPIPRKPIIST